MADQAASTSAVLDHRWKRGDHVMGFASVDDYALHDMDLDEYFVLPGPVGALVWDLCDGVTSSDAMVERIVQDFDVDRQTALTDLEEFLTLLRDHGLITAS